MNAYPTAADRRAFEAEWARLRGKGFAQEIKHAAWTPDATKPILGETRENVIIVYATSPKEALRVLRHEIAHLEAARICEPYLLALNGILANLNQEQYRRTEKLADLLADNLEA